MEKGILLLAFGKRGYAYMAYNLAISIRKTTPDVKVCIAHDGIMDYCQKDWRSLFDVVKKLTPEQVKKGQPSWTKINAYDVSPFDSTLYLDVDAVVLQDLTPMLNIDQPIAAQVHGTGGLKDSINYNIWAKNIYSWAWFDIPNDGQFQAVQTSMMYFQKCDEAKQVFDYAKEKFDFPRKWQSFKWGGAVPDELLISGAAAHFQINLDTGKRYIFFGDRNSKLLREEIQKKFYLMAMHGPKNLVKRSYQMWYDTLMKRYSRQAYSRHSFMNQKHAG